MDGRGVREGELAKVMRPEALVGMLLAMGSGHKSTPKGGLDGLLEAALRGELREEPSGKFGEGAYKNEPWSIVALRKRVYAIRAFYDFHLKNEQSVREANPGWYGTVTGTLNSFALLLGTKPQHVPKVSGGRGQRTQRERAVQSAHVALWLTWWRSMLAFGMPGMDEGGGGGCGLTW